MWVGQALKSTKKSGKYPPRITPKYRPIGSRIGQLNTEKEKPEG
jgi:hypothetical protein